MGIVWIAVPVQTALLDDADVWNAAENVLAWAQTSKGAALASTL